jgi:excisionase family DNA binding protein
LARTNQPPDDKPERQPHHPPANPEERLLTIEEVAVRLRIGRSTAYRLCQQRRLPTLTIGKAVRVPADALEEWVRRNIHTV